MERMDDSTPWQILEDRICPVHPKAGRGTRPYPLSAMLRFHCVRLFDKLSHPGMEDPPVSRGQALLDESDRVRRFVGLWEDHPQLPPPPDETQTGQGLLEKSNAHPKSQGLKLREGTIVGAAIIDREPVREPDPEMRQAKRATTGTSG